MLEPPASIFLRWWSTTGFACAKKGALLPVKTPTTFWSKWFDHRIFDLQNHWSSIFDHRNLMKFGVWTVPDKRGIPRDTFCYKGAADPKYTTSTCFENVRKIWGWINTWRTISSHTNYVGVKTHRASQGHIQGLLGCSTTCVTIWRCSWHQVWHHPWGGWSQRGGERSESVLCRLRRYRCSGAAREETSGQRVVLKPR